MASELTLGFLGAGKMATALARGFGLGLQAPCVIAYRLEDGWDRPLADWQRELGLPVAES